MSATHPPIFSESRDTEPAQPKPIPTSNNSASQPATTSSNVTQNGKGHATKTSGRDLASLPHRQNKHPATTKAQNQGTETNAAKGVDAAGSPSIAHVHETGHRRKKAMASVAALMVGLASLGVRIAELVEEMG
ncbi:hypothetical protein Q7P36_009528 [Cladosporium allicinum]